MAGAEMLTTGVDAALLHAIVDTLPAMLAYWDADQRCRFANRAYETWFGITPEALLGTHMQDLLQSIYPLNLPFIEGALRGEPQLFEREIPDPAGGPSRYSQAHYIPDVVEGTVRGFCVLVVNITERRQAELALQEAERNLSASKRLAAMATLAAGVGHELNNPLAVVTANLELLNEAAGDPEAARDLVADAITAARRMSAIINGMRLLARGDTAVRQLVAVDEALATSLALASKVLGSRARVVRELRAGGTILGSTAELTQVFVNLLVNAAHALPEVRAERSEIRVSSRREGEEVVIEIADNGCGISEAVLPRVFEPFFTTKDIGAGMGLGLSIANGIVTGMGGTIGVTSRVGEGSVFRVVLPAGGRATPGPAE
jgi:PAS domain S-box-containing protein